MRELIERLREDADGYGHGPTTLTNGEIVELRSLLREAAAALEAAREDAELAAKWRFCTTEHPIAGDEVIKCHINVGVNVWQGPEWVAFYECSPDELRQAIDQARGKENGNG